jgi:hypothetical protein
VGAIDRCSEKCFWFRQNCAILPHTDSMLKLLEFFFKNLEHILSKYQFREDRIFNVDESGITTVQKKSGKVYVKNGQKQVGVAISAERGQTITILCAVSAAQDSELLEYFHSTLVNLRRKLLHHLRIFENLFRMLNQEKASIVSIWRLLRYRQYPQLFLNQHLQLVLNQHHQHSQLLLKKHHQ